MSAAGTRVVFVTGLSGSGRTTAMGALEDLGYYCVDNIPPQLVEQFLALCAQTDPPVHRAALAVDAREEVFLAGFPGVVSAIRARGGQVRVLFLDCADQVLVSRYRETRRVHPLAPAGSVEEGIARERRLLEDVSALADSAIDTTRLNVHQLRETVIRLVSGEERPGVVNLVSFGYRYGVPPACELVFDVRFLPNPHFEPALRAHTGLEPEVSDYVLRQGRSAEVVERVRDWIAFVLDAYGAEGKAYLSVGIGCTGGRHRSVAISEALAARLRESGLEVNVQHRDVEKDA